MKTLYERALVELIEIPKKESRLSGIEKPNEFQQVNIHSWGTNVDGSDFLPGQEGAIGYIKVGTQVTPFDVDGKELFIVDRRFIQIYETI